jgi:hypothetical protein
LHLATTFEAYPLNATGSVDVLLLLLAYRKHNSIARRTILFYRTSLLMVTKLKNFDTTVYGPSRASTDACSNLLILVGPRCLCVYQPSRSLLTIDWDCLGWRGQSANVARLRHSGMCQSCKPPYSLSLYVGSALQGTCTAVQYA